MTAHPLLRVSAAGLRHAARLRHLPAGELAQRVYRYHAAPASGEGYARLRDWPDVRRWLGLDEAPPWSRSLDQFASAVDPDGYWMHWRRPGAVSQLLHKIYLSPRIDMLPGIFPRLVETCHAMEVPAFKIGCSSRGLLRADKLVAYFANRDHLAAVADDLAVSLRETPVHGVPFTPPLDSSGLLSWGFDPAGGAGSWRLWIAHVIADAVHRAPGATVTATVAHVRAVLHAQGVDADTWEPIGGVVP